MARLGDAVRAVRSKNAGPFMITIDVFCGTEAVFQWVNATVSTVAVAQLYRVAADRIDRYELPEIRVVKFSFPRPAPQGSRSDRDMHGAQWAVLLAEAEFEAPGENIRRPSRP